MRSVVAVLLYGRSPLHFLEDVRILDVEGERVDHRIVSFLDSYIEVVLVVR